MFQSSKQRLYEALLPLSILLTMKSAQVLHSGIAAAFQIRLLLASDSVWPHKPVPG